MKKIILASSNPGKIKEVQDIFQNYEIMSLKDAETLLNKEIRVTEAQDTFAGNALEKARGLYEQVGADYICIADDSGLSIDCLDGSPGVHTARWMDADDHTKNLALLEKVDTKTPAPRSCHYTTAIAVKSFDTEQVFEATLDGVVASSCRGNNGFGFDEIFELPDGRTLAEIPMAEKNEFSPRRQALDRLGKVLEPSQTIVYIDGQNFLYKVAERLILNRMVGDKQSVTAIDIPYLINQVLPNEDPEIRYYGVTKIRQRNNFGPDIYEKSIRFADNLRKIRNCLTGTGVKYCPVGTLKVRDRDECKNCGAKDYKFQEKGVDVGLAVDLVKDVLEGKVGHVVLLASDTDLMPAIKIARENKVRITYLAFDNQITQSISRQSDATQVIRDYEVIAAFAKANKNHN